MKRQIKVVAFDCDGVMFDSKKANVAYYNNVLNLIGKPEMNSDECRYAHMHTVHETLEMLVGDGPLLAEAHAHRRAIGYQPFIELMEIEPDLRKVLNWLKPQYLTAIATNRTDTMENVLEIHGLTHDFDTVVSASDVKKPKPHPDCLIEVARRLNASPDECIYLGDTDLDEKAAHAAGTCFVAFGNPALSADFHIDALGQIKDVLAQLG